MCTSSLVLSIVAALGGVTAGGFWKWPSCVSHHPPWFFHGTRMVQKSTHQDVVHVVPVRVGPHHWSLQGHGPLLSLIRILMCTANSAGDYRVFIWKNLAKYKEWRGHDSWTRFIPSKTSNAKPLFAHASQINVLVGSGDPWVNPSPN